MKLLAESTRVQGKKESVLSSTSWLPVRTHYLSYKECNESTLAWHVNQYLSNPFTTYEYQENNGNFVSNAGETNVRVNCLFGCRNENGMKNVIPSLVILLRHEHNLLFY